MKLRALLRVRFRALLAMFGQQKKGNSNGVVVGITMGILLLVLLAFFSVSFYGLSLVYRAQGLDWLYFALAGLFSLAMGVLGTVFSTQNQLYAAKDNDLMLSLPLRPGEILLGRIIPLLTMTAAFCWVVLLPAGCCYALTGGFRLGALALFLLEMLALPVLAQAICCLLGWLLHLLLSRMNQSVASIVFMVAYFVLYYWFISSVSEKLVTALTENGQVIAQTIRSWVWPFYAFGQGACGGILHALGFLGICAAAAGIIYLLLSATFLKTARQSRRSKQRALRWGQIKSTSAFRAMLRREGRRFVGSPVYLTNSGMGIVMMILISVAAVIFRRQVMEIVMLFGSFRTAVVCVCVTFFGSMVCITPPSVSLEGKTIWILRSMPVSGKQVLQAKLAFHCLLAMGPAILCGAVLAAVVGCSWLEILICMLFAGVFIWLDGSLGLVCGLQWAKLDWISEAEPCKQSAAIVVPMLGLMAFSLVLGALVFGLQSFLSLNLALLIITLLMAAGAWLLCGWLFRAGVRKWETLV